MKLITKKKDNNNNYQCGDIVKRGDGYSLQLHKALKNNKVFYYASFLDGQGMIGESDSTGKYFCPTIDALIKEVNSTSTIVEHYSRDEYNLWLLPKKAGEK